MLNLPKWGEQRLFRKRLMILGINKEFLGTVSQKVNKLPFCCSSINLFPAQQESPAPRFFKPIKAGGSHSMYSLGINRNWVEMHVHPIFQGKLVEKKIRPITLIVWLREA